MAASKKRGQQQQQIDDDDEDPIELSDSQRTEITNLVNAAVSGQLQRKLPKAIGEAIAQPMADLRTLIESNAGGRRAADDDDDEELEEPAPKRGKGGRTRGQAAPDPEKENMRKRLDALEQERRTEREQTRSRDRDGQLREHLTKLGVDPNRMRGAVAVLRESTKYDDKTGEWSYIAKREGFEDELDIAAGASEWIKSDEGKSYLAPAGSGQQRGGSGTRVTTGASPVIGAGAGGGRSGGGSDPKAAKQAARQEAVKGLSEAVNTLAGGAIPLG